jgi:hypothetical protein
VLFIICCAAADGGVINGIGALLVVVVVLVVLLGVAVTVLGLISAKPLPSSVNVMMMYTPALAPFNAKHTLLHSLLLLLIAIMISPVAYIQDLRILACFMLLDYL